MKNLLPICYYWGILLCLLVIPSCQEDISESLSDPNPSLVTKSVSDIDGGSLPEVVVCANFIKEDGGGGAGGSGGIGDWGNFDYNGWWTPFEGVAGGGIGGGGGGGSSHQSPVTVKLAESLIKLFPKNSNLSKNDLEKLNNEYKRMLVHCEYKAINDYLLKNFNLQGSILMESATSQGLVAFTSKGDLIFKGSETIDATNMAHEWIHMCQEALMPGCVKNPSYEGALEFELAVLQDVFHYKRHGTIDRLLPGTEFPDITSWTTNLVKDGANVRLLYKPFIQSLSEDPDRTISGLNFTFFFNYFSKAFFENNRSYMSRNLSYDPNYGYSNLKNIIALTNNCFNK